MNFSSSLYQNNSCASRNKLAKRGVVSPFVLAVLVADDPVLVVLGGNFDFFVRERFSGSALLNTQEAVSLSHAILCYLALTSRSAVFHVLYLSWSFCVNSAVVESSQCVSSGANSPIPEYHTSVPHVSALWPLLLPDFTDGVICKHVDFAPSSCLSFHVLWWRKKETCRKNSLSDLHSASQLSIRT